MFVLMLGLLMHFTLWSTATIMNNYYDNIHVTRENLFSPFASTHSHITPRIPSSFWCQHFWFSSGYLANSNATINKYAVTSCNLSSLPALWEFISHNLSINFSCNTYFILTNCCSGFNVREILFYLVKLFCSCVQLRILDLPMVCLLLLLDWHMETHWRW